jgi:hypothetical protein
MHENKHYLKTKQTHVHSEHTHVNKHLGEEIVQVHDQMLDRLQSVANRQQRKLCFEKSLV